MGLLDKLKFWEKDDEFELGKPDFGAPLPGEQRGGEIAPPGGLPGERGSADFGLGPSPGAPGALGGQEKVPAAFPQQMPPREPRVTPAAPIQAPPITGATRELEIINLKLDSIRNTLENMNIRLERLEKMARGEEHKPTW